MKKIVAGLGWLALALGGGWAYGVLMLTRGEPVNSAYILLAALCTYALGFRFYSKWIAARVLMLNDRRATPCEVHDDGRDFVKTNRWIVFGHHFAAISGPGPLVGPVLAAQFGYLPGTLWILIGVVLGGAVQDFVILFASMRRNGKSLGQMLREELSHTAGALGIAAILGIMIILLAVLALVVVKALAESPWGVFTVSATIPIAFIMGGYLRYWRVGKVLEASTLGVVLLLLAVWGGQFVHATPALAKVFRLSEEPLAWGVILYGLAASILPVWLLLAPRDYLSTFMKLGTIFALAVGVLLVLPDLRMPALSQFVDGSGLVVPGKLFPFCFITIACGAISGFHTLISSGTTPKIITREGYARSIGYGAMCLESLVAIMAMIAACTLDPGVYLSMNVKVPGANEAAIAQNTAKKVTDAGFPVSVETMNSLAKDLGETTLFGRTGGAATLAVGMAQIFARVVSGRWLDLWYHFAIMFEALFILTTLDAGTRVGRYLLQDVLGHLWKPLADTKNLLANTFASVLVVGGWGFFLIQGVRDPDGGVKALWPIFGIANQLLASLALCLATTVILKMHLGGATATLDPKATSPSTAGPRLRPVYALVTLLPLIWLLSVTVTAGLQKIFHEETRPQFPRIGFLQIARELKEKQPALAQAVSQARDRGDAGATAAAEKALRNNRTLHFNNWVDVWVTGAFLVLVLLTVSLSAREWILLLARRRLATIRESEPVWLPEYAIAEARPLHLFSLFALCLALIKELSGQAYIERSEAAARNEMECLALTPSPNHEGCAHDPHSHQVHAPQAQAKAEDIETTNSGQRYAAALDQRYRGVTRCC